MADYRIPSDATPEEQQAWRDVFDALERMSGSRNWDLKGRRLINAGHPVENTDYVTLGTLREILKNNFGQRGGAIIGAAAGGGGGGGGGGSASCADRMPITEFEDGPPDESGTVAAYASANPSELADSCQPPDGTGTWDFMDGVIAALQAIDTRWGYNGKRGDPGDLSHDAISFYCGELASMTVGSKNCFVLDIIVGHCGSPGPTWIDVSAAACGAWVPTRE